MPLYTLLEGYCTMCLKVSREGGKEFSLQPNYCVKIGNTNLCEYHLNEIVKEFDGYVRNKD